MRVRLQKWGNSLAVRVPRSFAAELGIGEGAEIDMALEDGAVVLRPAGPRYALEQLVRGITPDNRHGEVESGPSTGGEAW